MMIGGGGSFLCTCCSRGGYTITEDACMTILLSEFHISYDAKTGSVPSHALAFNLWIR